MPGPPTSHIVNIVGSRFLKICFLDLVFSTVHILRTLFDMQVGEGSYLEGG